MEETVMDGETLDQCNFTPRAQQVLVLARAEANRLNHNFVGTEHILLGFIRLNQGVAVNVLKQLGLDLNIVLREVEKQVSTGSDQGRSINIPDTPRVKMVLSLASKEAKALNHTHVGTEHVLLGILREGGGLAARVLRGLGLTDIDKVRETVLRKLDLNHPASKGKVGEVPEVEPISQDHGYGGVKISQLGHQFVADLVVGIKGSTPREESLLRSGKKLWFFVLDLLLALDFNFSDMSLEAILALNSAAETVERLDIVCKIVRRCGSDKRLSELIEQIRNLYNVAVSNSSEEKQLGRLLQRLTGKPPRRVGPEVDWLKEELAVATQPDASGDAESSASSESAKPPPGGPPF